MCDEHFEEDLGKYLRRPSLSRQLVRFGKALA